MDWSKLSAWEKARFLSMNDHDNYCISKIYNQRKADGTLKLTQQVEDLQIAGKFAAIITKRYSASQITNSSVSELYQIADLLPNCRTIRY